jgi:hypothetical protein
MELGDHCHDWQAPLPADLADFVAGKALAETSEAIIWSRHDR